MLSGAGGDEVGMRLDVGLGGKSVGVAGRAQAANPVPNMIATIVKNTRGLVFIIMPPKQNVSN
jgi:hypothetical protein